MRTTLTLEDDISVMLTRLQRELHLPFKQLVNDSLREGLAQLSHQREKKSTSPYVTKTVSVSEVLIPNINRISETLAIAEGENYK